MHTANSILYPYGTIVLQLQEGFTFTTLLLLALAIHYNLIIKILTSLPLLKHHTTPLRPRPSPSPFITISMPSMKTLY